MSKEEEQMMENSENAFEEKIIPVDYEELSRRELVSASGYASLLKERFPGGRVTVRSTPGPQEGTTIHETVAVHGHAVEIVRDIQTENDTTHSTVIKIEEGALWLKGDDEWTPVPVGPDSDSYRLHAHANRLIMEAGVRLLGSI